MTLIDFFFLEVDESQEGAHNPAQEDENDLLPNRSVLSSESIPLGTNSEATLLRRSQRENIHRCRFEVKGEAFICTPLETNKPKNYQEAMKFSTFEE